MICSFLVNAANDVMSYTWGTKLTDLFDLEESWSIGIGVDACLSLFTTIQPNHTDYINGKNTYNTKLCLAFLKV